MICKGSAHDAGGMNVVERASVVVGWARIDARAWGVWRARRWFDDILAVRVVEKIESQKSLGVISIVFIALTCVGLNENISSRTP